MENKNKIRRISQTGTRGDYIKSVWELLKKMLFYKYEKRDAE